MALRLGRAAALLIPVFTSKQASDHLFPEHDPEKSCVGLLQTGLAVARGKSGPKFYSQELANMDDVSYTGSIVVGGQKLEAVMDTGSYELVVFSKDCQGCGAAGKFGFDAWKSDSFQKGELVQQMQFGSGATTCVDAFDTVLIGPQKVDAQPMWQAIEADMEILDSAEFQALVGLGPPTAMKTIAETDENTVEELESKFKRIHLPVPGKLQNKLDSEKKAIEKLKNLEDSVPANLHVRFLSICLEQAKGAKGHLYWNDMNPTARPEHFRRLSVIGQLAWTVSLKDVKLTMPNGKSWDVACKKDCTALLDSGTSLLATPPEPISTIYEILNALKADCSKLDELPALEFDLSGVHHVLPPDVYMGFETGMVPIPFMRAFGKKPFVKIRTCSMLIMDLGKSLDTQSEFWILGMPFFRYYYTTFDFGRGASDYYDESLERSIWTAPADSKCSLQKVAEAHLRNASGAQQLMRHLTPRHVNMAKLRMPTKLLDWAHRRSSNVSF